MSPRMASDSRWQRCELMNFLKQFILLISLIQSLNFTRMTMNTHFSGIANTSSILNCQISPIQKQSEDNPVPSSLCVIITSTPIKEPSDDNGEFEWESQSDYGHIEIQPFTTPINQTATERNKRLCHGLHADSPSLKKKRPAVVSTKNHFFRNYSLCAKFSKFLCPFLFAGCIIPISARRQTRTEMWRNGYIWEELNFDIRHFISFISFIKLSQSHSRRDLDVGMDGKASGKLDWRQHWYNIWEGLFMRHFIVLFRGPVKSSELRTKPSAY